MIDLVKLKIKAGDGGNGVVSFFKLLNMRYGKPDGGDGGNGGSVFFVSDKNLFDLEHFRGRNEWRAESGENGKANQKKGRDGNDLTLKVPQGTVMSMKIIQEGKEQTFSYDFEKNEEKVLVAKGGRGGKGNTHARFRRDHKGKRPEHWDIFNRAEKGKPGEIVELTLELKYLAQVGLIGLPNAGKSSVLAALTNARPKIASYPFTTLSPNIGVLEEKGKKIVLADIPGIIEGAAQGKGLGLTFLKHIERTNLLIHILDLSDDNYLQNYQTVHFELDLYNKDLKQKKELVVLNKSDLVEKTEQEKRVRKFKKIKPIVISAQTGQGLEKLHKAIVKWSI